MSCPDWIQVGLSGITLVGVLVALIQPIFQRKNDRMAKANEQLAIQRANADRIRTIASLYLDVFEAKAEAEKQAIQKQADSLVISGKFEDYNRINYQAIEATLLQAKDLPPDQYAELRSFVKYTKISKNMKNSADIDRFLLRIRKPQLRTAFPREGDLATELNEAIVE